MLPLTDQLICFIQQTAQQGVRVVNTTPLEVEGPNRKLDQVAEVMKWFRAEVELRGKPGLVDKIIHRLCGRLDRCRAGFIDWERAFPDNWVFTIHEQELLAQRLGREVWIVRGPICAGRLEGVAPGRCFITPAPYSVPVGGPVPQHLQRIGGVVTFPSKMVSLESNSERPDGEQQVGEAN